MIVVSAVLTGCGSGRPGAAHPAAASHPAAATPVANGPVCGNPAAVSAVRVTRIPWLSQLGRSKPLPGTLPRITVRDPAKARALARAVCGLPAMPRGVLSCPIDTGGGYQLVFTASGRNLHPVTVQATGCEAVTGAGPGPTRWVARTPGFWTTFAHLTGIRVPAHSP